MTEQKTIDSDIAVAEGITDILKLHDKAIKSLTDAIDSQTNGYKALLKRVEALEFNSSR